MSASEQNLKEFANAMKRDWDSRARENAKWFINTAKLLQSDDEFYDTGRVEVEKWLAGDLLLLTQGRDPTSLRLLEIGCGIGRMTKHLSRTFGEVCGIDVSGEMIRLGRDRLQSLSNVRLYETSGLDFAQFSDEYFDVIVSAYVFQHVPTPEVIRSNIKDAYRVLNPGGVLRFQVNSVSNPEFDLIQKDTWTGATFTEKDIRTVSDEIGAQLISISGVGTQYCWAAIRKRLQGTNLKRPHPRIEAFGRGDDLSQKAVPIAGDHSHLTIIVSGLCRDEWDANTFVVEVNEQKTLPYYVGPVSGDALTQVQTIVPTGVSAGIGSLRVRLRGGEPSDSVQVGFLDPAPITPRVELVTNAVDGGVDIHASGPKSLIRLFVAGLHGRAQPSTVKVEIANQIVAPASIEFLPANGLYHVKFQIPAGIMPGRTELRLRAADGHSPTVWLDLE
jgi:ubiquinone/menaquinone biosynthesis C-methylase UbiE